MLPAGVSLLWDLREYFYEFHRLLTDSAYQQAAYHKAVMIAPVIARAPEAFACSFLFWLIIAGVLYVKPRPDISIDSFNNNYINIGLTLLINSLLNAVYVLVYARALDVVLLAVVLDFGDLGEAIELLNQYTK